MKRRAFFGLMGGAAVAGPAAAKQAIAKLPVGLGDAMVPVAPVGMSYASTASPNGVDGGWKLKEIANLRKFLIGDLTDEEKESQKRNRMYAQQNVIGQSVASLVSVSGVRKLEIYRDRMETHNLKIQESDARQRLHWLLREDD
jgi:hypothetical protein